MVIGGRNDEGELSNIEVVSLQNEDVNCNPQQLPYGVTGHSSVYLPSLKGVVTCGGYDEYFNRTSKCIVQSKVNFSTNFASMNTSREDFAMVSNGQKIFSFGGYASMWDMETIDIEGGKWVVEKMPFVVRNHCVVRVHESIIITGGTDFTKLDEVSKHENIFLKDKNFYL